MPGGTANCLNCVNAGAITYKQSSILNDKVIEVKCKARDETMVVFKDFYCHFFEGKR